MNILILTTYIAMWGFVHSLQASFGFKNYIRKRWGTSVSRAYRFLYNVFSFIGFAPIVLLMRALPDQRLYMVPAPWNILMYAGQVQALMLLFVTFLQTDALAFIGLRQMIEEEKPVVLKTDGFYR